VHGVSTAAYPTCAPSILATLCGRNTPQGVGQCAVALYRSRRRWRAPPRSTPCDAVNLTTGGLACRARRGDIPHHGVARAAALRASASYSGVRLTPKVRHSAVLLAPPSKAVRIVASFSSLMAWSRPPRFLRRLAAANPTLDAFLRQGAFVLGQRPKHTEPEDPLRCGGIHLLGQRAKRHAARAGS
jgi:hypothetical protein